MRSFNHLKTYLLPVVLMAITLLVSLALPSATPVQAAGQIDLVGPAGSGQFGQSVAVLPNGNIVITDPLYDAGSVVDVGAVYLYNGATHTLISALTGGAAANDQVGSGGVTVLSNGNYVVSSPKWNGGKGAVTWVNGTTGISGTVSVVNSLVGSKTDDQVGSSVTALSNGNYVVSTSYWDNGSATNTGAVTWGNGASGIVGAVSSANSLVGSKTDDNVGNGGVTMLSNSNYVVSSPYWGNGSATAVGAVTWGNGASGIVGVVSSANSLVGNKPNDQVGSGGVTVLSNGNYVVCSPNWDNGSATNAGAATWGNGASGIVGVVSSANSLVGSKTDDQVGYNVTALSNGNYVVSSPSWDNGAVTNAGAVTWENGASGVAGVVSSANSLVGSKPDDNVGSVTALSNGNYVVSSLRWDNGAATNAGAVTWGNGASGIIGVVSSANSLVGSKTNDYIGNVTALSNGNYVVSSSQWGNGSATSAGAVTWGNGASGIIGVVSSVNSLVGNKLGDRVGYDVIPLSNGNYVVRSLDWSNGSATNVGAVTWGNGASGVTGVVSSANSLVGSKTNDRVGSGNVTALSNGNYVVSSPSWDNNAITNVGAVTWGNSSSGVAGTITAINSVRGTTAEGGGSLNFAYDKIHHQLVVGRPADNIVTFFDCHLYSYLPVVVKPLPTGALTFENRTSDPITIRLTSYETRIFPVGSHVWSGIPVGEYDWEATGFCSGYGQGTVGSTQPGSNRRARITIQANQTITLNAEKGGVFSCGGG